MAYKSVRLLVEAIRSQMDEMRKTLMGREESFSGSETAIQDVQERLVALRELVDQVMDFDKPTIDEVNNMSVGDYVRTMKPLVARYHRQLLVADKLQACLCEDLQALGCVLILIGDKTIVRTAHDPNFPNAAMGVEAVLQALEGMNKTMQAGVEEYEKVAGVEAPRTEMGVPGVDLSEDDDDFDADDPSYDDSNDLGDEDPLRVRYADPIQREDADRNERAVLVIDMNDDVVKDAAGGLVPRKATEEEIASCIVVKDPTTGVGYYDGDDLP